MHMRWLEKAIKNIGDYTSIQTVTRLSGGMINESYYVQSLEEEYFIKHHANSPKNFFELEANGLEHIDKTQTISIPRVFGHSDVQGGAYLLLEWIEGERQVGTDEQLGSELAELHRRHHRHHGYLEDTYIGLIPQPNGLFTNWLTYYRDKKLMGQIQYGISHNHIDGKRRIQLEVLLEHLDKWIPSHIHPSYLHGDLWSGNWIVGPRGKPYLIDPSFLYGDRHFELAFTELFGGFSQQFYDAYQATYPLLDIYDDVKPLYQLYYLLVHLNTFGESYGSRVDAILNRYIGK